MRIGFDVDGVLANFTEVYGRLLIEFDPDHEVRWFPDSLDAEVGPPCWHWDYHYGYSKETTQRVWNCIKSTPSIWAVLPELDNMALLRKWWLVNAEKHDIYFITNRPGDGAKLATEEWLRNGLQDSWTPTVLIVDNKGAACRLLNLDIYIDDRTENVQSVAEQAPTVHLFIQSRAYNRDANLAWWVERVESIQPMFDAIS